MHPAKLLILLVLAASAAVAAGAGPGLETTTLILPADRPDSFTVVFERGGESHEILLERHLLRAPEFRVRVYGADGRYESFAPAPPATYRGRILGVPVSQVFAQLAPGGLSARVLDAAGGDWGIRPAESADGAHEFFRTDEALERPVNCPDGIAAPAEPPTQRSAATTISGQHLSQLAFDVDFEYYLLKGSSVQASVDAVEAIVNQIDFFYARDVMITYDITEIVVRTSQFYFPSGGGNLLDLFRNEWNTNQTDVVRDQAHLMTNKSGIEYGGLAYVGAVCNVWAYGWSLDSPNIVGHELGHNWGAGHCHDLAPCNNMCGGCFYVAPVTKEIKTAYRDSLDCLDDAGAYPVALPPYAHPEEIVFTRNELAALASETFDVLGNDHDGNLDPLSIDAFDATSEQGGTVSLSAGSGPEGRDELVYTPPGFVFPGADGFEYTVGDGTGQQQQGNVTIRVPARRLVGYWKLDESGGTSVADASNWGRHGTIEGAPAPGPGAHDGALRLDGTDDGVILPPMQLRSNTVTIAGWIRRLGSQTPWAGLFFSRDENTIAGLSVGNAHELRYHWNGGEWSWNSGLVVPDQVWVFVALVVEPDRATLYLHDGTLQSATHGVAHAIEEFDGAAKLGHDPDDESRRFRGLLDDFRLYDYALSATEIAALAELGGPAVAPNPIDGGHFVPPVGGLSWLAGWLADSHEVYFGEDYEAVRDAGPASPEHLGGQTATSVPLADVDSDQVYAWRVDEVAGTEIVPGEVWLFTRAVSGGHWPLDETEGSLADDVDGANDGSYRNGVTLGEPGATASSGTSVGFDGADDYVELPALQLHASEMTITGWARRDGIQHDWAGLAFSRAGSTTAGISTRGTGDLRYHWNDAYWDWHSGLKLPDGAWAFFAFVVRPDMATIYLGEGGTLASASNATLHGVEEFDGPLDLGRDGETTRYFKGLLDDVRIWRAALSPRDILGVYQSALSVGAGEVPDGRGGMPLRLARATGGDLLLTWDSSCVESDLDYGVYEGELGEFEGHTPVKCSTGGALSTTLSPGVGDRYFLVVPLSANREGSYGASGEGASRSPSSAPCALQEILPCE